jgi:hypothetical protein
MERHDARRHPASFLPVDAVILGLPVALGRALDAIAGHQTFSATFCRNPDRSSLMIRRLALILLLTAVPSAHADSLLADKLESTLKQSALAQVIGAEAFCNIALNQVRIDERIKEWELRSKKVAKAAKRYRKYLDMIETADKTAICGEAVRQAREWGILK